MQAPVLADLELTLALVHHIFISNDFQEAPQQFDRQNEQIFAFIHVRETDKKTGEIKDITNEIIEKRLLPSIRFFSEEHPEYHEEPSSYQGVDGKGGSIGITPMLFIGVLLKWYGFRADTVVVGGFESLTGIDKELMMDDKTLLEGNIKTKEKHYRGLNTRLAELNANLTGLRSRVNYVAESAQDLIRDSCTMTRYVADELNSGEYDCLHSRKSLKQALRVLDSSKFVKRDNDKMDLIARAMRQYQVDIESLKVHLTINIELVSNFDVFCTLKNLKFAHPQVRCRITTLNFSPRRQLEMASSFWLSQLLA